jgi:hypothetical protein
MVKNTDFPELDSFQGNQVGLYLNNVCMIFNDDYNWFHGLITCFVVETYNFGKVAKVR